jgi:hypothetical protein
VWNPTDNKGHDASSHPPERSRGAESCSRRTAPSDPLKQMILLVAYAQLTTKTSGAAAETPDLRHIAD